MSRKSNIDPRLKLENRKRRSGFIISIFMMFLLLILMSSFILRYVYSNAANVQVTQDGVASIYQAVIGETPFVDDQEDETLLEDEDYYNTNDDDVMIEEQEDETILYTDGSGIHQGTVSNSSRTNNQTN